MNKGKRWQNDENILIVKEIINNNSINNISKIIERSEYAVIKQLEKILLNDDINMIDLYNKLLIQTVMNNKYKLYKQLDYEENRIEPEIPLVIENIIQTIEDISELNEEQLLCYNLAKTGKNLFITGAGGSGKSTVLKKIIKYNQRKNINIGITASTGIAASLIGGTTLHSYLKIGIGNKTVEELYNNLVSKKNKSDYYKLLKLEILIIDEISMIDNILFSKIAAYLSLIKNVKKPFGGIQIILCGDFYQLPPINNTYCFKAKIWNRLRINTIILKNQMRQIHDLEFQNILENIKINNITDYIYDKLSLLKNNKINNDIKPTIIYSKNIDIDRINSQEFNNLVQTFNYDIYNFPIQYDNNNKKIVNYINKLENKEIKLCKGLQIMVTHNIDINNQIVNGTRGIIVNIDYPNILIKTINNMLYYISYVKYTHELDNEIQYNYIPIKLAYALTVHKSQGQTLDYIEIDLGESIFEYGMAYVALSRAKKLNSIYISNLSKTAFKVNNEVIEFYNNI